MRRDRRFDGDRRPLRIERHRDGARVQMQAGTAGAGRGPVNCVADDRPAQRGAVDPKLMRAARYGAQFEPANAVAAPQHTPARERRLARWVDPHPPAALRRSWGQRKIDFAVLRVGAALDHGPVNLLHCVTLKQIAEPPQRLRVTAEHEAARGFLVEAVRRFGPARQAEPERVEMPDQRFAPPSAPDARAGRPVCRSPA
jgi:hypothetical protein